MEDLAASFMPYPHSAPLYLLYDTASIANANANYGLAPPLPLLDDDDDDGFAFATTTMTTHNGGRALRACASDVSAAAFADELFRAGALLPLSLPPRLQRPGAYSSAGPASAVTSPTSSSSAAASSRKHRGFDPFAAALEKVRRDDGAGAPVRRARSLSPLRGASAAAAAAVTAAQTNSSGGDSSRATAARRARKGRGVRHLLCRVLMASAAAAAPRALWPRRKHGGVSSYRPGLLVCLGYGV